VQVADGDLILEDGSGGVIDQAPVAAIIISTPRVQRALGGATFVQMNGHKWSIDFGFAYQADKSGLKSTAVLMLNGGLKAAKFARRRSREFGEVLAQEGVAALA
jgi:hypothetical protein